MNFLFNLQYLLAPLTCNAKTNSFAEIDTNGLQVNDLIEWKGVISTRRAPAQLYIFAPFSLTRSFTVMKMEIQGARNKVSRLLI